MKRPVIAIVGLGLIGGSLARVLRRRGYRVLGVDRAPVRRRARAAGAVAEAAPSLEWAVPRAGVVVLAAPPEANLRLLGRVAALAAEEAVITDVGSVKGPICREARRLRLRRFVGGHPMAGRAAGGFRASSARLFEGRPWILTPGPGTPADVLAPVAALVRSAGARPVRLSARSHDRLVAVLSHAPQLASWALLDMARGDPGVRRHLDLAGPGFADMTRLARSPERLWREILGQNAAEVGRALGAFEDALKRVARRLL